MALDGRQLAITRERLGRVGVWLGSLRAAPMDDVRSAARRIEALGYGSLWTGEAVGGREAFAFQGVLLSATDRLVTGTGIANLWARHPYAMEGGATTLGEAYPGRFVLGVGVSHAPMVDSRGMDYAKPLRRMREYLDGMDAAAADHPPDADAWPPVPRLLAALRPGMLQLAAERADGAHPYFVPVDHTPLARAALGPGKLLVPEQAVVVDTDPATARATARRHMELYLQLPNYVRNLRHLGYGDQDLAAPGSDRLVDAIVAWGDPETVARRVTEHLEAGADHVLVQPLGRLPNALAQLEALAPELLGS
ncbi:MAG TPA: TIGR03620 family F420-dependent LLM class oxidoreductase [Acidimicrobiales bacterium]|jgi:probable F420-dependent oxidoreductase|nr:TIGR03620 family F420-dependent LLM class oxidoreductase [Acidimicrobiales bacterium]